MANENTARRNIYLPPDLDKWFVDTYEKTGVKVNAMMLEALTDYVDKHAKHSSKKSNKNDAHIRKIALNLLVEKGLLKL